MLLAVTPVTIRFCGTLGSTGEKYRQSKKIQHAGIQHCSRLPYEEASALEMYTICTLYVCMCATCINLEMSVHVRTYRGVFLGVRDGGKGQAVSRSTPYLRVVIIVQ